MDYMWKRITRVFRIGHDARTRQWYSLKQAIRLYPMGVWKYSGEPPTIEKAHFKIYKMDSAKC